MIVCANPKAQYKSYKSEIDEAISKVLEGDKYILGDEVEAFETEFADFNRSKYCIGVGNGTDAIEISLRALDIGPGDEVITVSHTAVATISAIERVGASPVLVDIDYNYFSLDTNYLEGSLTSKTKAIVLVHLYGQAGDIVHVEEFCKKNDLYLIEDVAQ
ncbi:MAG: erythromycin biosynthesis sensory transduction protein eryC1, partial [Flavobacteriales bacterium]|nr:erythromycin biosynthesis sensory transduction protein eryC1 [Flavobacteriales bacterium]